MKYFTILLVLFGGAISTQISAHHGYPQYNMGQRVPMQGTVITYRLGNPHTHMTISVINDAGEEEVWAVDFFQNFIHAIFIECHFQFRSGSGL